MTDAQAYTYMLQNHPALINAAIDLLKAGQAASDVLSAIMLYGDSSDESRNMLTLTRQTLRHALTLTGHGDRLEHFGLWPRSTSPVSNGLTRAYGAADRSLPLSSCSSLT